LSVPKLCVYCVIITTCKNIFLNFLITKIDSQKNTYQVTLIRVDVSYKFLAKKNNVASQIVPLYQVLKLFRILR